MWSSADASLDPFELDAPADFLAANPNMSFDFSQSHLNSDLDVTRLELGVRLEVTLGERLALYGAYRYLEFDDDAPYLADTSGSVDLVSAGLGWVF